MPRNKLALTPALGVLRADLNTLDVNPEALLISKKSSGLMAGVKSYCSLSIDGVVPYSKTPQ